MNKGMQRYLDSLPPGSVKRFTTENCPALREYERQMREETIPAIERAIKAQRRAAHFCLLGIPDPALVASDQAAKRLDPTGVDPLRCGGCGCLAGQECALDYGGPCRWDGTYR